ncbi:MAG TPA: autotransporter-associated beta strand repeat-containing protein [Rariglobus sp.]
MKSKNPIFLRHAALLSCIALNVSAATSFNWDPSATTGIQYGNGTWDTSSTLFTTDTGATNVAWSNGAGDNIIGFSSSVTGTAPSAVTVTLGTNILLQQINMGGSYGSNVIIGGNGNSLTFTSSGTPLLSNNSSSKTITIDAVIAGTGVNLKKSLQGTIILTQANTYTGTLSVLNGKIVLGTGGSLVAGNALVLGDSSGGTSGVFQLGNGGGAVDVTVSSLTTAGTGTANAVVGGSSATSTLTINNSGAVNYGGLLGGSGTNQNNLALAKSGTGTLTLSGANTYLGTTRVNAGTLALGASGSLASTTYSVANGATFDVSAKSTYSLASAAVTLDVGSASAGFFNGPTGALTLGNALTINFSTSTLTNGQTYNLFDYGSQTGDFSSVTLSGSITGSLVLGSADTWTGSFGGYDFTFSETTGILSLQTSAVPEPSTFALISGALTLAGCAFRRNRSRHASAP